MSPRSKANPFAQSPTHWQVLFTLPAAAVGTAEESFNDSALSVASFETDEANHIWTFEILFEEKPDMDDINRRLMLLSALHGVPQPQPELNKLEQQDWLAQVARSFPPLSVGRFYIYGSHVQGAPPVGSIAIQVDAGAAFGSGEHGTTSRCLEALEWLSKQRRFRNILDMGCGSGILAIAAAKLWRTNVLAVDIDPVAVRVTQENIAVNRESAYIAAAVSDGYSCEQIKRSKPFDLIVANILARPLVEFAPDLANNLSPDGVAVLSGLLVSQEKQVLAAHRAQGLKLRKRFVQQEWCTLLLER